MPAENDPDRSPPSRIWLWVVAAFVVQLAAWGVWLVIASQHKVQEVPVIRSR